MTKKKIFTSIFFSIICILCCCLFIPNKTMPVYASSTGAGSFTTSMVASNEYCTHYKKDVSVQSENKIMYADNITINYTNSTMDTNNNRVMESVSSISLTTQKLPKWSAGAHSYTQGWFYVNIYKDDVYQETITISIAPSNTYSVDMSGLQAKYSYYTFSISSYYEVNWQWLWNKGTKCITYTGGSWRVNTPGIKGNFSLSMYDINNNNYTSEVYAGGSFKTDNKEQTSFFWTSSQHQINTYASITYLDGSKISDYYAEKTSGDHKNGGGFLLAYLPDGQYKVNMRTDLGKTATYYLTVAPFDKLLNIEDSIRTSDLYYIEYESKISWDNNKYSVSSISINGHTISNGSIIKPGSYGLQWNVEYAIEVTKTTGAKDYYNVVFTNKEQVDLTANRSSLEKSPIARWYETYLLDTEEKTYNSWASYDNALHYAIQRENGTVTQAYYDGGTWTAGIGMDDPLNRKEGYYYIYKKRDNSEEKNAYFTKDALDSSILEYAKASITNNTYNLKKSPATPYNGEILYKTKVENGVTYELFLLGEFSLSKRPYVNLWINDTLQNFGGLNTITIKTPGQYKIEEKNPFGDSCIYYIYIQNCAPEIQYIMKDTSLKQTLTSDNTRFGDYFDLTLFDLDDDSLLLIEKSGIGSVPIVYTYTELLDIFTSDKTTLNYLFAKSGTFTVTAINHWTAYAKIPTIQYSFNVSVDKPYINEPSVNKEKNELTLSWGIPVGANCSVTTVTVKKYNQSDDSWIALSQDSFGTTISYENSSFRFNTQGYYALIIIDNYGREFSREYAFSREKPSAILTVGNIQQELSEEQIGYFNKKVTITWYDNTITAKMYGVSYSWNDGIMIKQNLNASDYISGTTITSEGYYIIELLDIDYNSRRFTFFIDQKAPVLELSANDKTFESGGYKNCDVSAIYLPESEYETPISISVTKNSFPISYPENGLFVEEGTYKLTLVDGAGNSSSYEFTIDKTAPEGQLFLEDGTEFTQNGITNKGVYCTWIEDGVTAVCNENVYYKGSILSTRNEENYKITLTDKAGNTSIYTFKISQNIPIVVMRTTSGKTIANNTTVDESFIISWEDPNYTFKIEIVRNGQSSAFTRYTEMSARMFKFEESGSYRFTFTNAINNTYIYSVNANMRPSAIITAGVENLASYEYTNKNVTVTISDRNSIIEVYKSDENNDYKTYSNWSLDGFTFTITDDGSYKIVIRNDFDLSNNYFFSIKTSLPLASLTGSAGEQLSSGDEFLGTVKVSYDKDEVEEFKVYLNGEIYYGETEEFSEVGRYIIYLTDKAGNQSSYNFEIITSNDLNWAGIVTLITMFTALIGVGIFLFLKFKRPFKLK